MALYFFSGTPNKLLAQVKKAIDDKRITTWAYDADGDFTHTADQWNKKAWLRPEVMADRLAFYIIRPKQATVSTTVYAIYHGRFIETMLAHCDDSFSIARATSLPSENDNL